MAESNFEGVKSLDFYAGNVKNLQVCTSDNKQILSQRIKNYRFMWF